MNLEIEVAHPSDFSKIAALDRIAWLHTGEPYIADGEHVWRVWCEYATVVVARIPPEMRSELKPSDSEDDSEDIAGANIAKTNIAGAVVMFPTNDERQFLHKIMVDPQYRGHGLGAKLMIEALSRAAGAAVLLTVDPKNSAAITLYEKFGFKVIQHIKGYYRSHEDRLLMSTHSLNK